MSGGKPLLTINNCRIYVKRVPPELCERFNITEGEEVNPILALYLLNTKSAEVVDEHGNSIDASEIVKCFSKPVHPTLFFVFQDLVKRGKRVTFGDYDNELIIAGERTLVYVMDEDSVVRAAHLYGIVDRAIKQGYRVLISVVDMHGDVTYYEVGKMSFPRIERREAQ
ncbi:MAG: hypothetical protein N3D82_03070 [Ignisphaera sp.]|nr:hypothetical protein [Ignisphaera sp.]MCX8167997.1 hypothetical protein [Ignisphaera sp.]MDW8085532.1 hypothetical protein [Ignisphaera sp.]